MATSLKPTQAASPVDWYRTCVLFTTTNYREGGIYRAAVMCSLNDSVDRDRDQGRGVVTNMQIRRVL